MDAQDITRTGSSLIGKHGPVIAIDGPSGSGKSTVARELAKRLDLIYLDTGAMYRAVTWLVLQSGIPIDDEAKIAKIVDQCEIKLAFWQSNLTLLINDCDVTQVIRTPEITAIVPNIASQRAVRECLVKRQREYGSRGGIVAEGRDIGTHVFPDADLKIFIKASICERARRRHQDFHSRGLHSLSLEEIEQAIYQRDLQDSTRTYSPLQCADDAIELVTDNLTIEEVVNKIVESYDERCTKS